MHEHDVFIYLHTNFNNEEPLFSSNYGAWICFFQLLFGFKCLFCSILVTKIKEYLANVEINNAKINFNAIILGFLRQYLF